MNDPLNTPFAQILHYNAVIISRYLLYFHRQSEALRLADHHTLNDGIDQRPLCRQIAISALERGTDRLLRDGLQVRGSDDLSDVSFYRMSTLLKKRCHT